jgi:hypothetical protein
MGALSPLLIVCGLCLLLLTCPHASAGDSLRLVNRHFALRFDRANGSLIALRNRLTGETYEINGDAFVVEAEGFAVRQTDATVVSIECREHCLRVRYEVGPMAVEVEYTLRPGDAFAEKRMTLTCDRDYALRRVVLGQPRFVAPGLELVCYRYPRFGRPPGTEPLCTYFGRTSQGGFYTGIELPFDDSSLSGCEVTLAYAPSLKVQAGEALVCEPMYIGVYRRGPADEQPAAPPSGDPPPDETEVLPLPSESDAMVVMTSALLGPPRHGLVPMACGWHSEMQKYSYADDDDVEADVRSLDFLAECGIDWVSDSHPWGGETQKMNALREGQSYQLGDRVHRFLEHARDVGVKVVMWPTMNNTHPWSAEGRPFRPDRPEWLMVPGDRSGKPELVRKARANCLANQPFLEWLTQIALQGLATDMYESWAIDGSFFGDGGWFTTIIPVDCASDQHDHLPGDANYGCERALTQLIAAVRHHHPGVYIFVCRPPMDLGVWSLRNVDACFTLIETGTGDSNLTAGDEIRRNSRIRVHRDFFPHYLDQPLLFPSRSNRSAPPNWPRGKLDYILLSALSCSPNLLLYMPTKTGIPDEDKAEIRKWLDWGRENVAFLQVRKDLPEWPSQGAIDGSAHVVGDRGLIFLFNPGPERLTGGFALTDDSIGLRRKGKYMISQEYRESGQPARASYGESIRWPVPAESVVVLRLEPVR